MDPGPERRRGVLTGRCRTGPLIADELLSMNRQRLLLVVIGGLGALMMVKTILSLYQGALRTRSAEISRLKIKLAQAQADRDEAGANQREWEKFGQQTLSMDPSQTMLLLREELFDQVKKANLTKEKVDLGAVMMWGKNKVRVLTCTVTAEGNMEQMVRFLYALHRRPYAVRVQSLSLSQQTGKNVPKGQLKLNAKLETMILPPNGKVARITPVDLKANKDKEVDRTQFAKLDDYRVILDRKMWEEYVPPLPGKASSPTPPMDAANIEGTQVTLTWKPARREEA